MEFHITFGLILIVLLKPLLSPPLIIYWAPTMCEAVFQNDL